MCHFALLPLTVISAPALAQNAPSAVTDTAEGAREQPGDTIPADESLVREGDEILVIATRLRGAIEAPQVPVITLDEAAIQSYGVTSVADLISALSPQTSSGRGRGGGFPVILVNGQRIGSFREMRNFPPEAIRRVEVLPEEVALRYGFAANQRVVNLILKDNYASRTIEVEYGAPTRGGYSAGEFEASQLSIAGPRRLSLTASYNDASPLTEAERGVIQASTATPGSAEYRTLVADSRELQLGLSWTTGLGQGPNSGQLSANANIMRSDTRSLSGLDTVLLAATGGVDPLERIGRTVTVQGGAGLNLPLGNWQLNTTLDASHSETDTRIDRRTDTPAQAGMVDRALTDSNSATMLSTLIGRPLRLPAGEVSTTIKAGFAYTGIASSDTGGIAGMTRLRRGDLSTGLNLGIPIASRREGALAALGELTLNLSTGINRLSDFGTLADWSAGLSWSPTEKLGFQVSYLVNQAAPSLANLGNPQVTTFNVPVYDFSRGLSTLVTVVGGGNPALVRETQRDLKFAANWQLPLLNNSNLVAEYFHNSSDDVTASFPVLTPAIEAAFPGRVVRDAAGNLVAIDRRPVTFAETTASRLRYGFNVSGTIGKPQPDGGDRLAGMGQRGGRSGNRTGGPPPGAGGQRGPGGGGGGGMAAMLGGGGGQGRWNLSLYHTLRFTDRVLVSPGGPLLDLLGGDALTGGGVARHAIEFEGGGFHKGLGLRLSGSWAAPTTVAATGAPGSSDLRFGSVTRLNLRLFAVLGQQKGLVAAAPFFKGTQLSLQVENLFDSRQRVTDSNGTVPLSYQPDYLDPRGRFIELEFRKMF